MYSFYTIQHSHKSPFIYSTHVRFLVYGKSITDRQARFAVSAIKLYIICIYTLTYPYSYSDRRVKQCYNIYIYMFLKFH